MSKNSKSNISSLQEQSDMVEMLKELERNIDSTMVSIELTCSLLEKELLKLKKSQQEDIEIFHHFSEFWIKWLEFDIEKYELDRFAGQEILELDVNSTQKAKSIEELWKGINIFSDCKHLKWTIRFTKKARKKVLLWNQQLKINLLRYLAELGIGCIRPGVNCKVICEGPCANMVYFTGSIKGIDNLILFAILMDRLPVIKSEKVIKFKYEQYIKIIDIIKKSKDLGASINEHKESIKNDSDRWIEPSSNQQGMTVYPSFSNSVVCHTKIIVRPKPTSVVCLNSKESNSFTFNSSTQRWESEAKSLVDEENQISPFELNIINKLATAASGSEFIKFIRRIPNFNKKLTEEQENLIKTPGNVLAIGRSGTGKTTCSILRLLSTELLFRYSAKGRNKKFSPEDIDRSTVLHTVFITASPVLINEVKCFYKKIGEHIKDKLREKEEKLRENLGIEDNEEIQEGEVEQLNENKEQIEIGKNLENNSESDEDQAFEGQTSLEYMKDEDFPLFVTVRKIIFMIDAALTKPFFSRNKEGNVIGSNGKFQWHGEIKGALMISKDYKLMKQTEDIGRSIIESSDSDVELEYETESNHSSLPIPKKVNRYNRQSYQKLSYEIDFSIFSSKFYPKIRSKCSFSALLLWTEISAYIKGSSQSFRHPGHYLPKSIYQSLGRKVSMLSSDEKSIVWDFFIEYEKWKSFENAYDIQDAINYILSQIAFQGYNGVRIHYMMIDEVQDLTPATLNLLLQITEKKLFFSGDTAQTIAKGVGFRFLDLKSLFYESKLEVPEVFQLTMNFRTHNQILGLANSVIAVLETLFPLTIDKMVKEVSPKDGLKPIVLVSENIEDLIYILFGKSESLNTQITTDLGCNQVIIVRDQASKDKLPSVFKHALCLTVFESKGLEFDDVILYNFFTDSEAPKNMWGQFRSLHKKKDEEFYENKNLEDLEKVVPKLEANLTPNNSDFSLLCTELKHLYVAVTRPKKRLIIFDEDQTNRKPVEAYWKHMEVVSFTQVKKNEAGERIVEDFESNFAQKTTNEEWKVQGLKMLSNKYYEQAHKCFEIAGEKDLTERADAYILASKAAALLDEIEETNAELGVTIQKTRFLKKQLKMKNALALSMFIQAGKSFVGISKNSNASDKRKLLKEAARCFSSGNNFKKAAKIFKSIQMFAQAGEAEQCRGNYEEAGDLFCMKDEYTRAIEAYRIAMKWDKVMKTIYKYKELMSEEDREIYIRKYVPAAFEDLLPKSIPETNYINKLRSEPAKVILEESDESSFEDEEEIKEKLELSEKNNQNLLAQITNIVKTEVRSSESFDILNSGSSYSHLSKYLKDIDTEDEWLQVESGSIVDSLELMINEDGSIMSDYSLIENNVVSGPGKLIKTREDIFIEDSVMRKIIEYVSMFSHEVLGYLKTQRSSSSLVCSYAFNYDWEMASLIDLDDISPELLGLLLDILEEFEMYKLCLIVCNRYNLIERIGRFIVSIAFKYSNLQSFTYFNYKLNAKNQAQRAVIAFTALHNVFEMINPDFLNFEGDYQLGIEMFQGLIFLGYWKKVVFLLDKKNGLALSWIFSDFFSYARILGVSLEDIYKLEWVPNNPSPETLQHFIAGMDFARQNPDLIVKSSHYTLIKKMFRALRGKENLLSLIETLAFSIKDYFSVKSYNFPKKLKILESLNAWTMLMIELKSTNIQNILVETNSIVFEIFLLTCNYILKYLNNSNASTQMFPDLRHSILSPVGVRSIPFTSICSTLPLHTYSILHHSSPLLDFKLNEKVIPIDLEGQSYLLTDKEIIQAFSDLFKQNILNIIKIRRLKAKGTYFKLNSLGELWLYEFITNEACYSIETYDTTKICFSLEKQCSELKSELKKLKGEDDGDEDFIIFMSNKNKKEIENASKLLNNLEKKNKQSSETFLYIENVLNAYKYRKTDNIEITESTRQALLTYAQAFIHSSEGFKGKFRFNRLWMAYELCYIADNLIYFIEMVRCRYNSVIINYKSQIKLPLDYHMALDFAKLAVYYKGRCLDSACETILRLLDTIQLFDKLRIYYLQLAVVYWVFSYKSSVILPESLDKFWIPSIKTVTKNEGKLRIQVLDKVIEYFLFYSKSYISNEKNNIVINQLSECLCVILTYIEKDEIAAERIKNFTENETFKQSKEKFANECLEKFKKLAEEPYNKFYSELKSEENLKIKLVEEKFMKLQKDLKFETRSKRELAEKELECLKLRKQSREKLAKKKLKKLEESLIFLKGFFRELFEEELKNFKEDLEKEKKLCEKQDEEKFMSLKEELKLINELYEEKIKKIKEDLKIEKKLINEQTDEKLYKFDEEFKIEIKKNVDDSLFAFKIIDEYPGIKTGIKGIKYFVRYESYLKEEIQKELLLETQTIEKRQNCANTLERLKIVKKQARPTQTLINFLSKTGKYISLKTEKLLEACSEYISQLYSCFYSEIKLKSLDFHYLLDQILLVSKYIREIENYPTTIESIKSQLLRLEHWKNTVKPAQLVKKQKAKKKWNLKWKNTPKFNKIR